MYVHIASETGPYKYLEKFTLNEADIAYKTQEIALRTDEQRNCRFND
ncbi:hypothetical protein SAMN02745246_01442 [Leeuwenhoekiella marinoflava DSM 3653]|uniref:Uncharacterized protein n=3 Tax=Leeuwenhoekiella marinoflava TaxID=988 RepID=A0A4Q0PNH9_9FLAO|nr:hypothetical protein DSL99_1387 [Leeuwenhoekiella marinoflava]SHE97299.1 hypothetical protein SAMN02745246_01442 [Leeuwenhoekiella marinoflava DSM 3653]